jgi:UDP-GlcNAc:undecaprenyl-phosphate GlcNAc-1-phosphate transferase
MHTLVGFVVAMCVTMVLIPLLMRWSLVLGVQDIPDPRKVHRVPVPRVGGIAMAVGVLLALVIPGGSTRAIQALWVCILILLIFGVWDDRKTLPAGPKFAGQALAVLIAMMWGGISISSATLYERMPLPGWFAVPMTFLFLVGGTNAFNLSDGLDGLAGGMATLCLSGTALLAYTVGNTIVGGTALIMVGALIGFLRFNTHPARIFMGDSGSQVLGFSAATLTLLLTQDPQIPLSTALPLLLLGVPIVDTLMVMTERLLEGKSPFLADRRHIHHRLLALGFEHWEAVCLLYLLQCCLFVVAWYLRYASDGSVIVAFAVSSAFIIVPIRAAQYLGLQVRRSTSGSGLVAAKSARVAEPHSKRSVRSIALIVLGVVLVIYSLWVLVAGARMSSDEQVLAVALAALLCTRLVLRWRDPDAGWIDKIALYPTAALALFLARQNSSALGQWLTPLAGGRPLSQVVEWFVYPIMAIAIVVSLRGSSDRNFRVTPLDVLVLLIALTIPNLPNSIASVRPLGISIVELVLLFYSLESVSLAAGRSWRWLSAAAASFLICATLLSIMSA